jgi:DNA-binding NarL/FixJ family response regulator
MTRLIRVGIIEDHVLLQRGLLELLNEVDDIMVVWTVATVTEAESLLESGDQRADVVIVDRSLPGGGPQNAEAVAAVARQGCRVLVLSRTKTREAVNSALVAGAHGYLSKHAAEDEIMAAIYSILKGETYLSSDLNFAQEPPATQARLTPRERDLVRLLARGLSDATIAQAMHIEITTVRTHLDRIERKAETRRRWMIVRWATENGLIAPEEDG